MKTKQNKTDGNLNNSLVTLKRKHMDNESFGEWKRKGHGIIGKS